MHGLNTFVNGIACFVAIEHHVHAGYVLNRALVYHLVDCPPYTIQFCRLWKPSIIKITAFVELLL